MQQPRTLLPMFGLAGLASQELGAASDDEAIEDYVDFGECGEQAAMLLRKIRALESMTADIEGDNRDLMSQLHSEQIGMAAQMRDFKTKEEELRQLGQVDLGGQKSGYPG